MNDMKKWMILGGFAAVMVFVGIVTLVWGWTSYNGIVSGDEAVKASWSQVENVLQRRYDLIPNLVATVKGYAKHEQQTFEDIAKFRSQWSAAQNPSDKIAASKSLEGSLSRLLVVMENYPQLKANENFLQLQDELAGTENRIAVERMRYNETLKAYNLSCRQFPGNLIASMFGFQKKDAYFEAKEAAKEAPKVDFEK
jgi:LemA protein